MKTTTILFIVGFAIFFVFMAFQWYSSNSTHSIETYPYKVIKTIDEVEIRKYESAIFSNIALENMPYSDAASTGFRVLAGYIFGGNQREEKIAMTSPVSMKLGNERTMGFMVPSSYSMAELPKPNNINISFEERPQRTVAAITFGGWANDERIAEYEQKLRDILASHGIEAKGNIEFLAYNPPFEVFGRRNEVILEVSDVSI